MEKELLTHRFDILRKERGWSKCKLNDEAGFSAGMIYQWYNTPRVPSIQHIEMICKACNISLSEFFANKKKEKENIIDIELYHTYMKLSMSQKIFIRDMMGGLLKMTSKENE